MVIVCITLIPYTHPLQPAMTCLSSELDSPVSERALAWRKTG